MKEETSTFLGDGLHQPLTVIGYALSERLRRLFPDKAILEGDSCPFDLMQFVEAGHCTIRPKAPEIHNQILTDWHGTGRGIRDSYANVWFEVEWENYTFDVVLATWPKGDHSGESRYWIIAEVRETAEQFFIAVCEWAAEVRGEVLVFDGGGWHKSKELFAAIQNSQLENLILRGGLKQEIAEDIARFFASREQYERYGVPWKRGILFLGPPGNGKTHCVKALINASGQPCLYVKSFKSEYETDQGNIRKVFQRARQTTPCILVMEDLDSLIDDENRAFFLNELDGFASNVGIVTLATTNHPERLDPSIVDRPSRFDRKYHFELPAVEERRSYIQLWNEGLQAELRLSGEGIEEVALLTEEFSFAYLKELFVSAIMQWINASQTESMDAVMRGQVALLREQMSTMATETVGTELMMEDPQARMMSMMMRRFRRR